MRLARQRLGAPLREWDTRGHISAPTARSGFAETEEREDLGRALIAAVREHSGDEAGPALDALLRAVDARRDW
ncbi:hypothetical protein [Cellulomonas olei]|uniref:hypothetical protein n=1 Tax=Cellulomonas sp. P4 TaxID=3142533 RepID=UPI0031BB2C70